jgi:hypothetical protein
MRFIKSENGTKFVYKDKAMTILHNETGPAIAHANGDVEYYLDGKLHRTDGPAISWCVDKSNTHLEWWVDGVHITADKLEEAAQAYRLSKIEHRLETMNVVLSALINMLKKPE